MEERSFKEREPKPTLGLLKNSLVGTFKFYLTLLEHSSEFKREWNYSKSSGWILKVFDAQKALFYFIPMENAFKINLTVREQEKEKLLTDENMKFSHPTLRTAKKYSEGYHLQFLVRNSKDAEGCNKFINKLISLRQ
jgi:hypothetical protein